MVAGRLRVLAVVATVGPGWGEDVTGVGEYSVTRVGEDNCSGSGSGRGTRRPPRSFSKTLARHGRVLASGGGWGSHRAREDAWEDGQGWGKHGGRVWLHSHRRVDVGVHR